MRAMVITGQSDVVKRSFVCSRGVQRGGHPHLRWGAREGPLDRRKKKKGKEKKKERKRKKEEKKRKSEEKKEKKRR